MIRLNCAIEWFADTMTTDSASDIANMIMNKTQPYRILYCPSADRYAIGDGLGWTHHELAAALWKLGYLPEVTNYHDVETDAMLDYMFIPADEKWKDEIREADIEDSDIAVYTVALRLTIGTLYLSSQRSSFNMQSEDPDLYQALKTRRLIATN